jgi:serine/threonine-protein kinase
VGDDFRAVLTRQINDEPPPLPPETPRALAQLVGTLLAKSPALRPGSATKVRESLAALTAWEDDERPTIERPQRAISPQHTMIVELPPRWHGIAIAISVLILLAAGAFLFTLRCL